MRFEVLKESDQEWYVRWFNPYGEEMLASEACGGVVESNMSRNTNKYLSSNLLTYIQGLLA